MAIASKNVRPAEQPLLRLEVLRAERISAHWMRVTVGGGEIDRFVPMGYDQWFRLFLPLVGDASLDRIPPKANRVFGYLRLMTVREDARPAMRNYTVREYRAATASQGAEIDIDFVLHETPGGALGPAANWSTTVQPGEEIAIIDEGLMFNPDRGVQQVLLVADETGLPAVAGVCASLPDDATGLVIAEVPTEEDALPFAHPVGVRVQWVIREDPHALPGVAALAALKSEDLPGAGAHAFLVGEQKLPTEGRRFLVGERSYDKANISFAGFWRTSAK